MINENGNNFELGVLPWPLEVLCLVCKISHYAHTKVFSVVLGLLIYKTVHDTISWTLTRYWALSVPISTKSVCCFRSAYAVFTYFLLLTISLFYNVKITRYERILEIVYCERSRRHGLVFCTNIPGLNSRWTYRRSRRLPGRTGRSISTLSRSLSYRVRITSLSAILELPRRFGVCSIWVRAK